MHDPEPPPRLQTSFARAAQPLQMAASPKRKRGPSDPAVPTTQPFAPRLDTSAFPGPIDAHCASASDPHSGAPSALLAAANVDSGSESPRSRIANQLERLQIHKAGGGGGGSGGNNGTTTALPVIDFGSRDSDTVAVATKKAKHNDSRVDRQQPALNGEERNCSSDTHEASGRAPPQRPALETAETPQPQPVRFATPSAAAPDGTRTLLSPSSSPSLKLFLSPRRPNPKLDRRSPSPSVRTSATSSTAPSSAPASSSLHDGGNDDQAALTWQDSEITGHEIDRERDDDGYGINGLGFRPTHAVAQHRALKRRQQILEWRAREAREARQKRSERRRLAASITAAAGPGSGGTRVGAGGEAGKRMVRFA